MCRSILLFLFISFLACPAFSLPARAEGDVVSANLCAPMIKARIILSFSRFWFEHENEFRSQIGRVVCSGENEALPMPPEEKISSLLGFDPSSQDEEAVRCRTCFGRLFIAKALEVKREMEKCLDSAACRQNLCPEPQNGSGGANGAERSLEDVYDVNARDLMAIP